MAVDDGSPDGTGEIVSELAAENSRVHLLQREAKRGLGSAYRAEFQHGLLQGALAVAARDADFSHNPETLPLLFDAAATFPW